MSGPPLLSAPPTTQAQGEIDFEKARKIVLRREDLPSGYSLTAPAQSLPITPEVIEAYSCQGIHDYRSGVSADWQGPVYSTDINGIPGARTAISTVQIRKTAERAQREYGKSTDPSLYHCIDLFLSSLLEQTNSFSGLQVQKPKAIPVKGLPSNTHGMSIDFELKGESGTATIRQLTLWTVVDRASVGVSYIDVGSPVSTSEALVALEKVRTKAQQEYPAA